MDILVKIISYIPIVKVIGYIPYNLQGRIVFARSGSTGWRNEPLTIKHILNLRYYTVKFDEKGSTT